MDRLQVTKAKRKILIEHVLERVEELEVRAERIEMVKGVLDIVVASAGESGKSGSATATSTSATLSKALANSPPSVDAPRASRRRYACLWEEVREPWAMNPVVRSDIRVEDFLNSVGGYRYKERRDRLLDLLDVDLERHMHAISDGERRRVQLCMGLMSPWTVLLLDKVTVDLDVQVRSDLLEFLKTETETRGATIV